VERLFVSKYIMLFLMMIFGCICMHYTMIIPFIHLLLTNSICIELMNMILAYIIEPIICILIVVILINQKEKQLFHTISL